MNLRLKSFIILSLLANIDFIYCMDPIEAAERDLENYLATITEATELIKGAKIPTNPQIEAARKEKEDLEARIKANQEEIKKIKTEIEGIGVSSLKQQVIDRFFWRIDAYSALFDMYPDDKLMQIKKYLVLIKKYNNLKKQKEKELQDLIGRGATKDAQRPLDEDIFSIRKLLTALKTKYVIKADEKRQALALP